MINIPSYEALFPFALPPSRDFVLEQKRALYQRVLAYLQETINGYQKIQDIADQSNRFLPQFDSCIITTKVSPEQKKEIILSRYLHIQNNKSHG